jgi:hypothetical protein
MGTLRKRGIRIVLSVGALIGVIVLGSTIHLFPHLRNPFAETTDQRSGPVLLMSIIELSRYEAASGNFQVVVDISSGGSLLPSFLQGSDTMFIGVGTENSYVDFSKLKGNALTVSPDRLTVAVALPHAQLESANLDVKQSYVFAQQQGLFTRVNSFLGGNPNAQQSVYVLAQQKIQEAATKSTLVADAERNTKAMLISLLSSLGFKTITVTFG